MTAELICFNPSCRARFPIDQIIYTCPRCGQLLETVYRDLTLDPEHTKSVWRARRLCNQALDQSGVWRYREIIPFLAGFDSVVSLREGNTPLLSAAKAAEYAGLDSLVFKH